jgi:ABC-2 type transport system permease protein
MQRKKLKQKNISQLGITLAIIVLLSFASNYFFSRIDLTSDKRYTLSEHTKTMLEELDDVVYFKVYLDGDLPSGFIRLKNATREILDEFRAYGKDNIQFEFIDPAESTDQKGRNELFKILYEKGLIPTNLKVNEEGGGNSQKIIFPGIIITYKDYEFPITMLKNYVGNSSEANLNASIQALEYELTFGMHQLTTTTVPKIAFIEGHGELDKTKVADITKTLAELYYVERLILNGFPYSLCDTAFKNIYDLIIIAKPQETFSESDKFLIDQFIMNGGKALWLIDNVNISMDSLAYSPSTFGFSYNLNLDDQLFKYGVRINQNLIQDMQCGVIPVNSALAGQQAKFTPAPWVYNPLISPNQNHTITRNLDMVKTQFVSTIDTVGDNFDVKKTILLASSQYGRTVNVPVVVDLSIVNEPLDPARFTTPYLPAAILLEGNFTSVFENRISPVAYTPKKFSILEESKPTKMIVISDGDIISNHVRGVGKNIEILPLGYDRFTKQTFGNKELILNCVNYLCDMQNLLEARTKEYKLRLLDRAKTKQQRLKWQLINVLLPIIIIAFLGVVFTYFRKKKYSR